MTFLDTAKAFHDFWLQQRAWSEKTFGTIDIKGPVGSAKHLAKEAKEAAAETGHDEFLEELADCQFMVFDTAWRMRLSYAGLMSVTGFVPPTIVANAERHLDIVREYALRIPDLWAEGDERGATACVATCQAELFRAAGAGYATRGELVEACFKKLEKNKKRSWPPIDPTKVNDPVEHILVKDETKPHPPHPVVVEVLGRRHLAFEMQGVTDAPKGYYADYVVGVGAPLQELTQAAMELVDRLNVDFVIDTVDDPKRNEYKQEFLRLRSVPHD